MRTFMLAIAAVFLVGVLMPSLQTFGEGGAGAGARDSKGSSKDGAEALGSSSLAAGSRILKSFDFDHEDLQGNFEAIPMFWAKVLGRGYPAYSAGHFDSTVFRSAGKSFKLEIDGGSTAFQYMPGKLPINPAADYYVLAFVKTTVLEHARAQISAWFADENGKLIRPTEIHFDSEPYASVKDPASQEWHVLHMYIPGPAANSPGAGAKSLVLQVGLLQPQQLAAPEAASDLGKFALYQQDIKGAAWFDDLVIFQLPRVSVAVPAGVTGNLFGPGQKVELDLAVSDLATGNAAAANAAVDVNGAAPLSATLQITDPDGLMFAAEKFNVTATEKAPWSRHFVRDALPPGLYTATLDVSDGAGGTLIARRQTRFLCLGAATGALEKRGADFGFSIPEGRTGVGAGDWMALLPTILRQTGANVVQLPAWRKEMSEDGLLRRDIPLDAMFATLQRMDVHAIGNFSEMPAVLASRISEARRKAAATMPAKGSGELLAAPEAESILSLADADPGLWRPYVSFLLARYGNRVEAWEFGSQATPYSGALRGDDGPVAERGSGADPRYPKLYAKTRGELAALLTHPRMVIPWNALFEFDPKQYGDNPPGLDLRLPTAIKPSQIPVYLENFRQALTPLQAPGAAVVASADAIILAHVDSLDERHYDRADRLADFAQRIVYARTASATAILIDLPMTAGMPGRIGVRPEPDELLLVYRTLIHAMGGARYVREITFAPGIKAFLFDRAGVGTLILWNESGSEARVHLDLPLGAAPRLIDLAGNARGLAVDGASGLAGVAITGTPIIVDQVDSRALALRASFALAASTFPAGAGAVRTELLLTNPYDEALTGTLKVALPKGWTIEPASLSLNLAAGATLRRSVMIRYPFAELAGAKVIAAHLETDGGQKYDFSCAAAITSDVVELDSSSQLLPNGDLVIQEIITNISGNAINAQAYATVPGYPRQQRYLLGLNPNESTVKRFVFPMATFVNANGDTKPADIAAALTGKAATVGLHENDGRTLITKALTLE